MRQWPIKLLLVHPQAPFLDSDTITLAADCTLMLWSELSQQFTQGSPMVIGCPMLEDPDKQSEKIDLLARTTQAKTVRVYTMEVPCCLAYHQMVERSFQDRDGITVENYIVRVMTGEAGPYVPGKLDSSMMEMEHRAHRGL